MVNELSLQPRGAARAAGARENYEGPLVRAVRPTDGAETDIGMMPDGRLDVRALVRFARGGETEAAVWYDQSPAATHWQAVEGVGRPLLTGLDGLPFTLGGANRPALRFRDNRGLANLRLALAGGRNMAVVMVWQFSSIGGSPHLLAFHGDLQGVGASPRLRLREDGRIGLEQYGNVGMMISEARPAPDAPIVLGVAYRGGQEPGHLWWVNGGTGHAAPPSLTWELSRLSVARLGHNGPSHPTGWHLDGLMGELYVMEGERTAPATLDRIGRALASDFGV
ncbi:hypothetical protein J4558_17035 [Leptolyngbya sp. 15MV]|nr:hypothetical protein J4558_17035 [Leptolyngbya sp. 15MV]